MDINDLKRRAQALREITAQVGPADAPRTVTLRKPTRLEAKLAAVRCGVGSGGVAATLRMERDLLAGAVVGWQGVTLADVLTDGSATEPLAYHAEAVPLLLDAQPDWEEALGAALFAAMVADERADEASEKN